MKLHLTKALLIVILSVISGSAAYAANYTLDKINQRKDLTVNTGDYVGSFDEDGKLITDFNGRPTDNLTLHNYVSYKNLTINGSGQVAVGGDKDPNYMGIEAATVTVNGNGEVTNLIATKTFIDKLHIQNGRVELHGSFTSGNGYLGYDLYKAPKMAQIKSALTLEKGYLSMGTTGAQLNEGHFMNGFGVDSATGLTSKSAIITQKGGSTMNVYGYSIAQAGFKIDQSGDGTNMMFRDRLVFNGNGTNTITQSDKATLKIGELKSASEENIVNIIQNGNGTIEIGNTISGTYSIEQSGDGGTFTLKSGGSMVASTVKQNATAKLTVEEGAKLTAASITISGSLVNKGTIDGDVTIKGSVARTFSVRSTNGDILSNTLENSGTINGEVILDGGTLVVADDDSVIKGIKTTENGGKIEVNGSVTMSGDMELSDAVELVFSGEDSAINMAENTELKLNGAKIAVTLTDADLENLSGVKLFTSADEEDANWGSYEVAVLDSTGKDTGKKAVLNYTAGGDVTLEAVPEPTTATLSLLALAALASRRRRK